MENAGDADVARAAALLAEPARAKVLMALADGRALPASLLATEAGVSPQTVSAHLHKLLDGGLVEMERSGRHRYYRLAGPEVAAAVEAVARIAKQQPIRSLRQSTRAAALREARTCYDHLAGTWPAAWVHPWRIPCWSVTGYAVARVNGPCTSLTPVAEP